MLAIFVPVKRSFSADTRQVKEFEVRGAIRRVDLCCQGDLGGLLLRLHFCRFLVIRVGIFDLNAVHVVVQRVHVDIAGLHFLAEKISTKPCLEDDASTGQGEEGCPCSIFSRLRLYENRRRPLLEKGSPSGEGADGGLNPCRC